MIKRQKLKWPLYLLTLFALIILIAQLAIIITQPITNYIGFDWDENNRNIISNDANNDGIITCPNDYLIQKQILAKQIFTASFSMMIIAFLCGLYTFAILCIHFFVFLQKDQEISIQKQNREFYRRMGSLKGLYDEYFTYPLMITLYLSISLGSMAQIVHLGACATMLKVYENCQGIKDGKLVALIVISSIIISLLTLSWVLLQWFRYQLHIFLDKNEIEFYNSSIKSYSDLSGNKNKNYKPTPFISSEIQSQNIGVISNRKKFADQDNLSSADRMMVQNYRRSNSPSSKLQKKQYQKDRSLQNTDSQIAKKEVNQMLAKMNKKGNEVLLLAPKNLKHSSVQHSKRPLPGFIVFPTNQQTNRIKQQQTSIVDRKQVESEKISDIFRAQSQVSGGSQSYGDQAGIKRRLSKKRELTKIAQQKLDDKKKPLENGHSEYSSDLRSK